MDRQTTYEPRPEIARMKSFDGERGFSCYHIKWAIGRLPPNTRGDALISSESFKTRVPKPMCWWKSGDEEWKLQFSISVRQSDEPDDADMLSMNMSNTDQDKEFPVITRVKLINESKGVVEYTSSAAFLLSSWHDDSDYDWDIPEEEAKKLSFTDQYTMHCWMDIPIQYNDRYHQYGQNSGPALLSSLLARSFEKITTKNGDPTSDVELVIKDGSDDPPRFYCHRHILSIRSPVFEMMFTNDRFKESNERIVEIEDMDGDTLKLFLEYLYTGEIDQKLRKDTPKQSIKSLLNAAEKYMLPELKDECVLALIGSGNGECADAEWIEHLQLADTFNLAYLKKICLLALSTDMRSLCKDECLRQSISSRTVTDLLDMVTKRGEFTNTIEVETGERDFMKGDR